MISAVLPGFPPQTLRQLPITLHPAAEETKAAIDRHFSSNPAEPCAAANGSMRVAQYMRLVAAVSELYSFEMKRSLAIGSMITVVALTSSCICPGHLGTKIVPLSRLEAEPGIQLAYMGSDAQYHYFFRRNCYSLFSLGEWSVTDRFQLNRATASTEREFPLTKDSTAWRYYDLLSTNSANRIEGDFKP